MIFYIDLFLIFLYFKIARVELKEEKRTLKMHLRNTVMAITAIALFLFGFEHYEWYKVVGVSYLFFIFAALIVSAVQVGVFLDGKPFVKLSHLHKSMYIIVAITLFSEIYLFRSA